MVKLMRIDGWLSMDLGGWAGAWLAWGMARPPGWLAGMDGAGLTAGVWLGLAEWAGLARLSAWLAGLALLGSVWGYGLLAGLA